MIKSVKKYLIVVFYLGNLWAQNLPPGTSVHQLDNGFQVLLIENSLLPMTGINVVVKTGSAYETFATSGMSHMLEHLLFNGTTTRTQKELYDEVDLIGGYNNANTSYFYTNYMMVTPAEHFKRGIEIQADMLFQSVLPEEKFEKEKGIVLEEIARSINSGDSQIERTRQAILFKGHAASLSTLGTYATIQAMNRDNVYKFYKNAYVPNNMMMSVIGNFDTDSMMVWLNQYYGSVAPAVVAHTGYQDWKTGLQPVSPAMAGIFHRSYNGKSKVLEAFSHIPYKLGPVHIDILESHLESLIPSLESTFKKKYAEQVESLQLGLLSSPLNDYLHLSLRLKNKEVSPDLTNDVKNALLSISLIPKRETIDVLAVQSRTSFLKNIEKPHMFGIFNAELFAVYGIEAVLSSYEGYRYKQAAAYLSALQPKGQPVLIFHHPLAEKSAGTEQQNLPAQRFIDGNTGLTTIIRQNLTSEIMAIHFLLKHKAPLEAKYGSNAAWVLHDCIDQRLKSPEIRKQSAQFGFTYTLNDNPYIPMDNIYLHPDFSYIRAEGLADNIAEGIRFLNGLLTEFSPTSEEFEKSMAKRKRIDGMSMPGDRSRQLFEDTYDSLIYVPNPHADAQQKLTYESLQQFSETFLQPANVIISIVSPGEAESVSKLIQQTYTAPGRAENLPDQIYDQKLRAEQESVIKELSGGGEQAFIFWGFIKQVKPEHRAGLTALSLILRDKITFDIREKQGRAYRMSSGIEQRENNALFYLRLGTRPENVEPIQSQVAGFFSTDYLKNVTVEEVSKSINMYLGRMMFRRLSSINQAYYLAHSEYFHQDITFDEHFLRQLQQVTLDDIREIAEIYLNNTNPVSVIVR
jgi:predicted Zn-dependent peptidase